MSRMRIPGRGGGGVSALAINVAPTEGTVMAGARSWPLIRDQSLIRGRGRGGACSFLFCMKIDSFRSGRGYRPDDARLGRGAPSGATHFVGGTPV
jgi:hypothetical protein